MVWRKALSRSRQVLRVMLCPVLQKDNICVLSAGNLAFPLLLVGGLFLLSRRQGGGIGGPGGNNPLNFGKSKAKFQMEPNTGITFDDVAGVDEAKADFMEVGWICVNKEKGNFVWAEPLL